MHVVSVRMAQRWQTAATRARHQSSHATSLHAEIILRPHMPQNPVTAGHDSNPRHTMSVIISWAIATYMTRSRPWIRRASSSKRSRNETRHQTTLSVDEPNSAAKLPPYFRSGVHEMRFGREPPCLKRATMTASRRTSLNVALRLWLSCLRSVGELGALGHHRQTPSKRVP